MAPYAQRRSARAIEIGDNVSRAMARHNLTLKEASEASGVDMRTLRAIINGRNYPQHQTFYKLACGIGVSVDELMARDDKRHAFDRSSNPVVAEVVDAHPNLFRSWTKAEYEELYSRRGVGGELTEEGVLHFARQMNGNREILRMVHALLETSQRESLSLFVRGMFKSMEAFQSPSSEGGVSHVSRDSGRTGAGCR